MRRLKRDYLEPLSGKLKQQLAGLKKVYPEGVDRPTLVEVPVPPLTTLPLPPIDVVALPGLDQVPLPSLQDVPLPSLKEIGYLHPIDYYYAQVRQSHIEAAAADPTAETTLTNGHGPVRTPR